MFQYVATSFVFQDPLYHSDKSLASEGPWLDTHALHHESVRLAGKFNHGHK